MKVTGQKGQCTFGGRPFGTQCKIIVQKQAELSPKQNSDTNILRVHGP